MGEVTEAIAPDGATELMRPSMSIADWMRSSMRDLRQWEGRGHRVRGRNNEANELVYLDWAIYLSLNLNLRPSQSLSLKYMS